MGNCLPIFWHISNAAVVAATRRITNCPPSVRKLLTPLINLKFPLFLFAVVFGGFFRISFKTKLQIRFLGYPNFVRAKKANLESRGTAKPSFGAPDSSRGAKKRIFALSVSRFLVFSVPGRFWQQIVLAG